MALLGHLDNIFFNLSLLYQLVVAPVGLCLGVPAVNILFYSFSNDWDFVSKVLAWLDAVFRQDTFAVDGLKVFHI